jgi:hypothetical protein
VDQDAAARLGHTRHFADAFGHVGEQHDAKLGSDHVEAGVGKIQRMAVHDAGFNIEALLARARPESLEHCRRVIYGHNARAQPRSRNAESATAGGDV